MKFVENWPNFFIVVAPKAGTTCIISVIVCTHNSESVIKSCILSIKSQSFPLILESISNLLRS